MDKFTISLLGALSLIQKIQKSLVFRNQNQKNCSSAAKKKVNRCETVEESRKLAQRFRIASENPSKSIREQILKPGPKISKAQTLRTSGMRASDATMHVRICLP